jgi:uncharacterized protein (UPF0147 family)
MLPYIAITVPFLIGIGVLVWDRIKLKSKLTTVESQLIDTVKTSDVVKALNDLRADEGNAKSHAYTMISKMKTELNKLGGR